MRRGLGTVAGAGALATGITLIAPCAAHACGGFFCSASPMQQAGETIVYGMEADGSITMAVQITYDGVDDDFAWILPVPVPPDSVGTGASALFGELLAATEPRFSWGVPSTTGTCRPHPTCVREETGDPIYVTEYVGGGCGTATPLRIDGGARTRFVPIEADAGVEARDAAPRADASTVVVHQEATVGPYDVVVLGAATAAEVLEWLRTRGYDIPTSSEPLLDAYASAGQVFVALRLSAQRTTDLLRPIVMHLPTSEACLPIRLTAIATVPDMPITAIFLGDARVAPRNYSLVEMPIGPRDLGLWTGSLTWIERVADEVDRAGGHAFVTDSAGARPGIALVLPSVADLAGSTTASAVLAALGARGYNRDPDIQPLLERYVVPPAGAEPRAYYNCLATGTDALCGAPRSFDPAGLAAAIESQITAPRRDADALVRRHPYLTRLSTTMDASEMTLDPIFVEDSGLPDVPRMHQARVVTLCDRDHFREHAPREVQLPGGSVSEAAGSPSSDRAYCSALGGIPIGEAMARTTPGAPDAGTPAPRSLSRGCAAAIDRGAWRGWALVIAALALVARRRRR